ncbi:hypothetical protein ACUOFC_05185, partial [Escherichia sp. TWPC-MK]
MTYMKLTAAKRIVFFIYLFPRSTFV